MTRRDRLMHTLAGKPVDRPAVNFYEINGLDQDPSDNSPFNIYADPSWKPLIEMARDKTDRTPRCALPVTPAIDCPLEALTTRKQVVVDGSLFSSMSIRCRDRVLRARSRRDPDVDTIWPLEHLLKDADDLRSYLELPMPCFQADLNLAPVLDAESALGDTGVVMLDLGDPLCSAAELFAMQDYLVIAYTERELFHRLLDRFAQILYPLVDRSASALPGRLWRVYGAEYASPPYLPPRLFRAYATEYTRPIVELIQGHGGYARIHSHGKLKDVLDHIADTGCMGLDPIEPPPQGDVDLAFVRERYGRQMVLFGNLEANDIEMLSTDAFEEKIKRALDAGTSGGGRGFVLMPSASPYGRKLSDTALRNYEKMIEVVEAY